MTIPNIANGASGSSVRALLNLAITQVLNVREAPYNAKGDGSTDDTVAIQAAINDAGAVHGKVIIPATLNGYKISNSLVYTSPQTCLAIPAYVTLSGTTAGFVNGVMLNCATGTTGFAIREQTIAEQGNSNGATSIVVANMQINGVATMAGGINLGNQGVALSTGGVIENVMVSGTGYLATLTTNSTTAAASSTLHFASGAGAIQVGSLILDLSNSNSTASYNAIPWNTVVVSSTATSVTMSNPVPVNATVGSGDVIAFVAPAYNLNANACCFINIACDYAGIGLYTNGGGTSAYNFVSLVGCYLYNLCINDPGNWFFGVDIENANNGTYPMMSLSKPTAFYGLSMVNQVSSGTKPCMVTLAAGLPGGIYMNSVAAYSTSGGTFTHTILPQDYTGDGVGTGGFTEYSYQNSVTDLKYFQDAGNGTITQHN